MSRVRGIQRLHGRLLRQLRVVPGVVGQYVACGAAAFGYACGAAGIEYARGAAGHDCAPAHGFRAAGIEHTRRTLGRAGCHPARAASRHSGALVIPGRGAGVRRARPRFVAAHAADGSRPR
ncbi:hypothetical protein [Streptomyces sp. NBC_00151]|uniref:hypothetical protein n=1 Tax=Streptomyces sp. NBC_00151 TaxID=2975669 RepID=UPI002DDB1CAD|nr:hypothetical protein [Streptomyces sp. NBC_00151]WRZ40573.1 hypothetical protein OG915_22480 [Streptomyces sp. NBC_00151]